MSQIMILQSCEPVKSTSPTEHKHRTKPACPARMCTQCSSGADTFPAGTAARSTEPSLGGDGDAARPVTEAPRIRPPDSMLPPVFTPCGASLAEPPREDTP